MFNLDGESFRKIKGDSTAYSMDSDTLADVVKGEKYTSPGIRYSKSSETNRYTLFVVGNCPRLQMDGTCEIYSDRPEPCWHLKLGVRIVIRPEELMELNKFARK